MKDGSIPILAGLLHQIDSWTCKEETNTELHYPSLGLQNTDTTPALEAQVYDTLHASHIVKMIRDKHHASHIVKMIRDKHWYKATNQKPPLQKNKKIDLPTLQSDRLPFVLDQQCHASMLPLTHETTSY